MCSKEVAKEATCVISKEVAAKINLRSVLANCSCTLGICKDYLLCT